MPRDDVLTNPPMPDWNDLADDEKTEIVKAGEMYGCQCCGGDTGWSMYDQILDVLRKRERRYLRATMEGPPADHFLNT